MLLYISYFLLGVLCSLLAQNVRAKYHASRCPPSRDDVKNLLEALSVWAEKYAEANPKKKCFKVRDGELFQACTKVGLMWLKPGRGRKL